MTPSSFPSAVFVAEEWLSVVPQRIGIGNVYHCIQKHLSYEIYQSEERDFFEQGILEETCAAFVCMTFQLFYF
tara:strand:+ start:290 stop:508 length:219 start_codon:yes stop_codon:yes gene_type:complete